MCREWYRLYIVELLEHMYVLTSMSMAGNSDESESRLLTPEVICIAQSVNDTNSLTREVVGSPGSWSDFYLIKSLFLNENMVLRQNVASHNVYVTKSNCY
jgi:hypothetical protein